jgi:exodeoxyribonuclease VII small subunit
MKKNNEISFERQLERLEIIVDTLEAGEAPLQELLDLYEEGMVLTAKLREYLNNAELRIEKIRGENRESIE